jgi:hypothetical protein
MPTCASLERMRSGRGSCRNRVSCALISVARRQFLINSRLVQLVSNLLSSQKSAVVVVKRPLSLYVIQNNTSDNRVKWLRSPKNKVNEASVGMLTHNKKRNEPEIPPYLNHQPHHPCPWARTEPSLVSLGPLSQRLQGVMQRGYRKTAPLVSLG